MIFFSIPLRGRGITSQDHIVGVFTCEMYRQSGSVPSKLINIAYRNVNKKMYILQILLSLHTKEREKRKFSTKR